jgi:hypothetical protein
MCRDFNVHRKKKRGIPVSPRGEGRISPATMIKKASSPSKPYEKMNARELAEATAEFDEPGIPVGFKPLDAAGRALWARVKRKRGPRTVRQARRAGRK